MLIKTAIIKKLPNGKYRLYSKKKDKSGKRKNLGTFDSLSAVKKHERAVQYFKHNSDDGCSDDKVTHIVGKMSDIAGFLEESGFIDSADRLYKAMDALDGSFADDEDYIVDMFVNTDEQMNIGGGQGFTQMNPGHGGPSIGADHAVFAKLVDIANKLDKIGEIDAANALDEIIKRAEESLDKIKEEKEVLEAPKPSMHIAVNDFAKRHTKESKYSYFDGTWDELVKLVDSNFSKAKPGYRDGVLLVPVPAERFYTSIAQLTEGTEFVGKYAPRRPGEKPYLQWTPQGLNKMPAKSVDIVLYNHNTLLEGKENSTDAEWEIISINASPWEGKEGESEPMHPETLMRNYFVEPGGTEMKGVTPEQFVDMLRKSREYWKDKTMVGEASDGEVSRAISKLEKTQKTKRTEQVMANEPDRQKEEAIARSNGHDGISAIDNQNCGMFSGFSDSYFYRGYGDLEGPYK